MKKIEKLPSSVNLDAIRSEWLGHGLSTEPIDRDDARQAVCRAYECAGNTPPRIFIWLSSPFAGAYGSAVLMFTKAQVGDQVRAQVRAQVWDQVRAQVWDQVWAQVGAQVRAQVGDQVWDQAFKAAKDGLGNDGASNIGWAGFAAWVSYFRDVCGWENDALKKFEIGETIVKSCGWTWWHKNVLAISDRPHTIKRDDEGRLHCENGPSIAYRDGWSLYHWHGVSIPPAWVCGEPPSAKEALTWANVEQRRAACEILGWVKVLDQLNAKVIDKHESEEIGTLLEADIPDSGKERFLRVRCGTGREFCLPVPREMKTALEANAWGYGLDPGDFEVEVRT